MNSKPLYYSCPYCKLVFTIEEWAAAKQPQILCLNCRNYYEIMKDREKYWSLNNVDEVKTVIECVNNRFPNVHHYISTIGIKNSDFSWIRDNITLQISLHSLSDKKRDILIPWKNKMTLEELGKIETKSNLKTTLNLTLVDEEDFDITILQKYFPKEKFFIKLSPINRNVISDSNNLGAGIIQSVNLL